MRNELYLCILLGVPISGNHVLTGSENRLRSMFSRISVMKIPAVLSAMQIREGSCSDLSITWHIFAFFALS